MCEISNYDDTLRQSIRWSSKENPDVETITTVNAAQLVICLKVSESDIRHYEADNSRSSHRCKRCPISQNYIPSAKIHVDASSSDCTWLTFSRSILQVSAHQKGVNTFEHWHRMHARCKLAPGCTRQHLMSNCCTIVVDRSFFPNRPWHISASWYVVSDNKIISTGDFITFSTTDYRPARAAELCGCLASIQNIDYFLSELNESTI